MKLLITCVPMILRLDNYKNELSSFNITIPEITQNMKEEKLIEIIGEYDYWIAGDDPVTRRVLEKSKLKYLIKWGIGIDNIDLDAIKEFNIPFSNTPGMFGNEVADVAIGYLLMLTRKLNQINNEVKNGNWYKPAGISLKDKKVGLIGLGDIGRNIANRLLSLKTKVYVYDPGFIKEDGKIKCVYKSMDLDDNLNNIFLENDINKVFQNSKIIILACSANKDNFQLVNEDKIKMLDDKSYIINVSRGSLVKETDIYNYLINGKLEGFASDVFENEPLDQYHNFINMNNTILGSHNASNTMEAVDRTSFESIKLIKEGKMDIKKIKNILFKNKSKKASIIFNMKYNSENPKLYSNFIFTLKWFVKHYSYEDYEYIFVEQDTETRINIPENFNIKKILLYNPNIFNRGWAYNVIVKQFIKTDVAIFCDSDIILQYPENLEKSVEICKNENKIVSPYNYVTFTTEEERKQIMGENSNEVKFKSNHPVTISGGIVTVNKKAFLEVGGFEEYQIYGGEDRSLDVLFMSRNKFEMLDGYGIHLYHPSNPTKKSIKSSLMAKHLKNHYSCSYNKKTKPYEFIHLHCNHKTENELKEHINLKNKYFGNIDLYKNGKEKEINSFPII